MSGRIRGFAQLDPWLAAIAVIAVIAAVAVADTAETMPAIAVQWQQSQVDAGVPACCAEPTWDGRVPCAASGAAAERRGGLCGGCRSLDLVVRVPAVIVSRVLVPLPVWLPVPEWLPVPG